MQAILSSHARFLFRAERREGVWRLAAFDAIHQRDEITTALPGDAIATAPEAVRAYRPSYRLRAYCLQPGGFPVRDDLAGEDRPDLVAALTAEVYGWADLSPPRQAAAYRLRIGAA